MRLTQIKLAGFKSFVDPTIITTPGELVGIVGPNGCGKSNVIDAVRWVLGESRASALRGESMQDVIFNGAGERQAVSRASVELLFDNSLGRALGQWSSYAELAIKRVLERDGDSTYYINNHIVRRRDITDLFLGTGLGPRAYAIIEQGMISRIIEAKPEELRVYLEEAAGVSKYKERRRETEHRLVDTRNNLARVEDIRTELGQQLEKLQNQAEVATTYRRLESELQTAQRLLWFSKQQEAQRARERHSAELGKLTAQLDGIQAALRAAESKLESLRAEHLQASDHLHEMQGEFYAANAEVTRLEQQLQFQRENRERIDQQVAQIQSQLLALDRQIEEIRLAEGRAQEELALLSQSVDHCIAHETQARTEIPPREEVLRSRQQDIAEQLQKIAHNEQRLEVIATNRAHAARAIEQLAQRKSRLQAESEELHARTTGQISIVEEQWRQEKDELTARQTELTGRREHLDSLISYHQSLQQPLQQATKVLTELEARSQALRALQTKVEQGIDTDQWQQAEGISVKRQLWQHVDVEARWEDALEAVLRERLSAIEVERLETVLDWSTLPRKLAVYAPITESPPVDAKEGHTTLLSKVTAKDAGLRGVLQRWLHGVYCARDIAAALAVRAQLELGECMVTPEGHLVGKESVCFFAPDTQLHGVLARQRELLELGEVLEKQQASAAGIQRQFAETESQLKREQLEYEGQAAAAMSQERRCHDLELELIQLRQAQESATKRQEQVRYELDEIAVQWAHEAQRIEELDAERSELWRQREALSLEREAKESAQNDAESALAAARAHAHDAERATQEARFAHRSCTDRLAELGRRKEAIARQLEREQSMAHELNSEHAEIDWAAIEASLQNQLAVRQNAEQALAGARDRLESFSAALRRADEERLSVEQTIEPTRSKIEELRLKEQAARLTEAQYLEQLQSSGADLTALPEKLRQWGRALTLPGEIERLQKSMLELGAVNLAALEELETASERKQYLDSQATDLKEAMDTLESAIRRIDRETRAMLLETFNRVNEYFAGLFPTLFGGGQARLAMSGEEILDAGVQVIAQPPGKRNTSIHLLSGGEKALTALALVFALFKLNPAPFCLLDEVDAPLDDANTERFCALVKDMALGERPGSLAADQIMPTQFIYISHNKISMEMANQLIGITMNEPGVSHVVAVDIAEALEMTEAVRTQAMPALA